MAFSPITAPVTDSPLYALYPCSVLNTNFCTRWTTGLNDSCNLAIISRDEFPFPFPAELHTWADTASPPAPLCYASKTANARETYSAIREAFNSITRVSHMAMCECVSAECLLFGIII